MSDGFNILAVANKGHDFICTMRRGILFNLQGKLGIFLFGRGLSGILAGYFNCWRPNLPIHGIWQIFIYVLDRSTGKQNVLDNQNGLKIH